MPIEALGERDGVCIRWPLPKKGVNGLMHARPTGYRPDVDGLRSIAVLPVVLFHAGVSQFSGGFVGVDIFFVISGYLITGILVKDIQNGEFSIVRFYNRRIRRIFPAFLLVCGTATILALYIFPPDRLKDFATSSASAILFVSNFYFWKSVDYFSTNTHVEPLIHTWSLSVEEQFYIFYPWLLYLASRFGLSLRMVIAAVLGASFVLCVAMLGRAPGATFYLLPPRAWELAMGGLLALNWIAPPARRSVATIAGAAGVALIAFSVFVYTNDTAFPGFAAVPPTLGTALIIWSGSGAGGAISAILAARPLVLIGRASYSFYLWHLPLLAFATYLHGGILPLSVGLALSALSLGLALATLFLIEDPVRRSRSVLAVAVPVALMLVLLAIDLMTVKAGGWPARFGQDTRVVLDTAGDKDRHPSRCMSSGDKIVRPAEACVLGTAGAPPTVLLWGDSHAMVTATGMTQSALRSGRSFLFAAAADCPPGLGFSISEQFVPGLSRTPSYRFCDDYNREMLDRALSDPQIGTVVISARWSNWRIGEPANPAEGDVDLRLESGGVPARSRADNRRIFEQGFFALVGKLRDAGKDVYLVGPVPEPSFDVPQRLYISRFGLIDMPGAIPRTAFDHRHAAALTILDQASRRFGAKVLRPDRLLCSDGTCPLVHGGVPVYFDHNHLSVDAAQRISPIFDPVFRSAANGGQ